MSRWNTLPDYITTGSVIIRKKHRDDTVTGRFSADEWHKIFVDIDTDCQLNRFLKRNTKLVRAYMLENRSTDEMFGWILLRRNDPIMCDSIEFHGGAWMSTPQTNVAKFTAACAIINHLLHAGIQVNSKAFRDNRPALRFLEAIGFKQVNRKTARPYVYLRLSRRRFYSSNITQQLLEPYL